MGYWNLYFIAKLALLAAGKSGFHWMPNLAFAIFLLIPLGQKWQRTLRWLIAIPFAAVLLYYDSRLPPFARVLSQMPALSAFTPAYLAELAERFINPWMVVVLCLGVLGYQLIRYRVRVTTLMLIGILSAGFNFQGGRPVTGAVNNSGTAAGNAPLTPAQLDGTLEAFYGQQSRVRVSIGRPAGDSTAPFDIVFLHICSLAWDDLVVAGQQDSTLFKHFDILFDNFNSAASYSGPAGIRVLRATCGQEPHDGLYRQAPRDCYLFDQLQQAGFDAALLMNHDGKFGDFLADLRERGGLRMSPLGDLGAAQHMKAFDGSPIYSDYDLLMHWLERRKQMTAPRTALFYSTVSLHDGNVVDWSQSRSSLDTYAPRLKQLLEDIDRFLDELKRQGRRTVVVFVPEHGANLRGDSLQIPGMREIPGPQITRIPVGVKLVGIDALPGTPPVVVKAPSSYTALSELLSRLMMRNPFEDALPDMQSYVADLPRTDFVAENDKTVVVQHGSRYYIRQPDGSWSDF